MKHISSKKNIPSAKQAVSKPKKYLTALLSRDSQRLAFSNSSSC